MKIGDLFVALGFQVEGKEKLDDVDTSLKGAAIAGAKLTVAIGAVNAIMLAMMNTAMKTAVALKNFSVQTGLSTQELQRWQHIAEVNDVSAGELTDTIKGLADARAQFALGNPQAVGAWQMLGVNPTQDPFKVLQALRDRFQKIKDPNVARALAGNVGISDNVFMMLRSSNVEFEKWNKNLAMTEDQRAKLVNLDRAWKDILFSVTAVKNRFMAELVPVFRLIAEALRWLVDLFAAFADWLHKGGAIANVVKIGLMLLAGTLLLVGVALVVVTAAVGALSVAMSVLDVVGWPVVAVIAAIIVQIGLLLATFVPLFLISQDWWTAFQGGKSFINWERSIKIVNTMLGLMRELSKAVKEVFNAGTNDFEEFFKKHAWLTQIGLTDPNNPDRIAGDKRVADFAGKMGYHPSAVRQENNTTIHINGAQDPKSTGSEVSRKLKGVHAAASRQMPVLSY